jgi:hypothetical protein
MKFNKKNIIILSLISLLLFIIYLVHRIFYEMKYKFINNLLSEWKKQTGDANIRRDKGKVYKNDYYLSFVKNNDSYNHIHLILDNCNKNQNIDDNIKYVIKKNNNNKILHSEEIYISIFSEPKIIVENMIKQYENFTDN